MAERLERKNMNLHNSSLWNNDIDELINTFPIISKLEDNTLLITGSTGLICSAVIEVLIRYNLSHDKKIRIIAGARKPGKLEKRVQPFIHEDWFNTFFYNSISSDNNLPSSCDYIIHGAGNSDPASIIKEPVETMLSNFTGLYNLLDYSRQTDTKRLLYISSSEIYGNSDLNRPKHEDDYGYIDLLNPRNSYSSSKRASETLCSSFYEEYKTDSVIARPCHVYGPTAQKTDSRVASIWPYLAASKSDIIMKSNGSQVRSFCYCLDCASALLIVLLNGKSGEAYNISNPASIMSIKEMAELLSRLSSSELILELPSQKEKEAFNPMNNSIMDCSKLIELGWNPLFDAERGFAHTIEIIKETALTI